MSSPETKYPAANEDIDTIITGTDGKDYIVDIIDGLKQWVLYLPEPHDEIIFMKVLPPISMLPKLNEEVAPTPKAKGPNKYQLFVSDITKKLKKEHPEMTALQRKERIARLWQEQKGA